MTNDSQTSDATQVEPRTLYLTRDDDERAGANLWLGPNSPIWKQDEQYFEPQKRCTYLIRLAKYAADKVGIRRKQCLCFVESKPEE